MDTNVTIPTVLLLSRTGNKVISYQPVDQKASPCFLPRAHIPLSVNRTLIYKTVWKTTTVSTVLTLLRKNKEARPRLAVMYTKADPGWKQQLK